MPRVPAYDAQVEARPLPGFRQESVATPALLGGAYDSVAQASKGLSDFGAGVSAVAYNMQERENARVVQGLEAVRIEKMIANEADIRQNRQGEKAKNVTVDVKDWWDKAAEEDAPALTNDAQRELYKRRISAHRNQSLKNVSSFEAQQNEHAADLDHVANNKAQIDAAAASTAPEDIAIAKMRLLKNNEFYAWRKGLPAGKDGQPGVLDVMNKEDLTRLHESVIRNMVNDRPAEAQVYFEENKKEIAGGRYDELSKLLKTGAIRVTAQGFTDTARKSGMTETEALKEARSKYEGETEHAVVQEIRTRYGEDAAIKRQSQHDAADAAYGIVAKTGKLSDVPATVLEAMDGQARYALQERVKGKMPETDWNKYSELREMARTKPEDFLALDLRSYDPYLGKAEREGLLDLKDRLSKPAAQHDVATLENQLGNAHDLMKWKASDKEKKGRFDTAVQSAVRNEEKLTGKRLDYDARQKVIDRLLISGDINGPWYQGGLGGTRQFYEVLGTPDAEKFVPDVPSVERKKIVDALTRAGKPVTDAEVVRLYKRKVGL